MLVRLVAYCRSRGIRCEIVAAHVDGVPNPDSSSVALIPSFASIRPLLWHPLQKIFLENHIQEFNPDIIHVHGVFSWIQRKVILAARKKGIPIVLSAHGMLEPWFRARWGRGKRLYWNTMVRPVLQQVDCLHAITQRESESLFLAFPGVPQVRIPNAIDLKTSWKCSPTIPDEDRYFLFLGRLHPIKGLDLLIAAFSRLEREGYKLVVAGPDYSAEYSRYLKQLVKDHGLERSVFFIGPVQRERKESLLSRAWAVVVPSYSEVIALVNLESAAAYTPTITTTQTGLLDWEESGGVLVDPNAMELADALRYAASWTLSERMQRGYLSRRFVEERYSWDVVGDRWMAAYQAISSGAPRNHA